VIALPTVAGSHVHDAARSRGAFQCLNKACRTKQIMPEEARFDPRLPSTDDEELNLAHFREI
jgi:hypothetical protein